MHSTKFCDWKKFTNFKEMTFSRFNSMDGAELCHHIHHTWTASKSKVTYFVVDAITRGYHVYASDTSSALIRKELQHTTCVSSMIPWCGCCKTIHIITGNVSKSSFTCSLLIQCSGGINWCCHTHMPNIKFLPFIFREYIQLWEIC